MRTITYEYLVEIGACAERRDAFRAKFPEGATLAEAAQWATHGDLRYVVAYYPALRAEAGARLLADRPTHADLCWIIEYCPALRDKAETALRRFA